MKKSALLIIDYQYDLVHPEGIVAERLGDTRLEKAQLLATKIQEVIDSFASTDNTIISVQSDYNVEHYIGHFKKKRAQKNYANTAVVGTKGHELYEVTIPSSAMVVIKHYFDGFYETNLHAVLQEHGVEDVYLCGVNTDACVTHTAIGAAWRGYHTFVIEDCTETISSHKEQALEYLARVVDVEMVQSEELTALLSS